MHQAAQSLTDERRTYLASVLASSLSSADLAFAQFKQLLKILGELNDIEVIILRAYAVSALSRDEEFREKHKHVIVPPRTYIGASQAILDQAAIHQSYREHLARLGLLSPLYETNSRTKEPELNSYSGAPRLRGYHITMLGRLLLRHVGLHSSE
jgi:hypothetical protein